MKTLQIDRVRDQVRQIIGEMIVAGEIPSGVHLDEINFAKQIGVSRTPVREALIALESEGLVQSSPRQGFLVVCAQLKMVKENFAIIGSLEALSIRSSSSALAKPLSCSIYRHPIGPGLRARQAQVLPVQLGASAVQQLDSPVSEISGQIGNGLALNSTVADAASKSDAAMRDLLEHT